MKGAEGKNRRPRPLCPCHSRPPGLEGVQWEGFSARGPGAHWPVSSQKRCHRGSPIQSCGPGAQPTEGAGDLLSSCDGPVPSRGLKGCGLSGVRLVYTTSQSWTCSVRLKGAEPGPRAGISEGEAAAEEEWPWWVSAWGVGGARRSHPSMGRDEGSSHPGLG